MQTLNLEIVTPDGMIFSDNVKSVVLPGSEGEFGVYPGHISLVSILKAGVVDIEKNDNSHEIVAIDWGYAKVSSNKIGILANGAVCISGSSDSQIAQSLNKAKELVKSMGSDSAFLNSAMTKIESSMRHA